jgi:glycosyltransferase involved in cell wall biosynthesis
VKVVLFSKSFGGIAGGIEKMCLLVAESLVSEGHSVLIISIDKADANSFYKWPDEVDWIKLDIGDPAKKSGFRVRYARLLAIRKAILSYSADTAVGFQVGAFALVKLATVGMRIKVVAAERNAPTLFEYIKFGTLKKIGSHFILSFASAIAVQFYDYRNLYPRFLRHKIIVTPNLVEKRTQLPNPDTDPDFTKILFVGRLTFQKNVRVLLEACVTLTGKIRITLIGEGPERLALENYARENRLDVHFLAPTSKLEAYFLDSDFLVMPSRWEGFPNVVAEALSFGVPVVAFEKCSGMSQLISHGLSGILAPGEMTSHNLSTAIQNARETRFDSVSIQDTMKIYTRDLFIKSWVAAIS